MPSEPSLDLARFAATPLSREPFDHVVVPAFVREEAGAALDAAFPRIDKGGSFPADALDCGAACTGFLDELQSPTVTRAFEDKFGIDLTGRPTMVTLRGRSRPKDGRIHADTETKLITALIYMNGHWDAEGGRLRLLRGPHDLEDYAVEVPPERGTLLAFRCTPHAYHGHKPFDGQRRSIQLNWVASDAVLKRELARHGLSARVKRLFRSVTAQ